MIPAPAHHHDPDEARAPALATLGLVALLVVHLFERVLPRFGGCATLEPVTLQLQFAMVALARAAWREIEAPCPSADPSVETALCAQAMRDALHDLMAALASLPRRPRGRPVNARPPLGSMPMGGDGAVVSSSLGHARRARDGPRLPRS